MSPIDTDILVVGSGIAGLTFALRVAEHADVVLVTKKDRLDSNTNYAQGGIAAVVSPRDSFDRHIEDTLHAGAGLCHIDRVRTLVRSGPQAVADLVDWGVQFSRSEGRLALGIEGGHSKARIVHSQDRTGAAIEDALDRAVAAHPRIRVLEDHMALSLLAARLEGRSRCGGAWVLDVKLGRAIPVIARATMLATGGSSAVYRHTTNPAIATGDGVAIAHRIGATVANMEFTQFHPTALYPAEERAFLISEALRGEGAMLRNWDGDAFMHAYDARADLAPRDIVARAVHSELRKSGKPHLWLDARHIAPDKMAERFPAILEGCRGKDIDPCQEPIPVVPAAHYMCGGVWTDRDARTTVAGLFAAGESACTGVHGANRLASNSLLEAVVFAERAAARMLQELAFVASPGDLEVVTPEDLSGFPAAPLSDLRNRLKQVMWDHLGIVRTGAEMHAGAEFLEGLRREWWQLSQRSEPSGDGIHWAEAMETLNMIDVARLAMRCARWRRESRGLHYVSDYPHRDNEFFLHDSTIVA